MSHVDDRIFDEIAGLTVQTALKGYGSFLTIEFGGDPEARPRLWVYMCDWELLSGGNVLVDSDSISPDNEVVLTKLNGRALSTVTVDTECRRARFAFEGGFVLVLLDAAAHYGEQSEMVHLFAGERHISTLIAGIGIRPNLLN